MNELIFKSPIRRSARKREHLVILVTTEAYDLIEGISLETGLSNSYVASEMIKFAAANARIEYGDDKED